MKIQQKSIKRKIKHKHSQYSKNITEKKTHTHIRHSIAVQNEINLKTNSYIVARILNY